MLKIAVISREFQLFRMVLFRKIYRRIHFQNKMMKRSSLRNLLFPEIVVVCHCMNTSEIFRMTQIHHPLYHPRPRHGHCQSRHCSRLQIQLSKKTRVAMTGQFLMNSISLRRMTWLRDKERVGILIKFSV